MQYWDIINFYGKSMCQCLPTGNLFEEELTERNEDNLLKSNLDTKGDDKHG